MMKYSSTDFHHWKIIRHRNPTEWTDGWAGTEVQIRLGNACRLMVSRKRIERMKIARRMRWLRFNDATFRFEFLASLLVTFCEVRFRIAQENIRTSTGKGCILFKIKLPSSMLYVQQSDIRKRCCYV